MKPRKNGNITWPMFSALAFGEVFPFACGFHCSELVIAINIHGADRSCNQSLYSDSARSIRTTACIQRISPSRPMPRIATDDTSQKQRLEKGEFIKLEVNRRHRVDKPDAILRAVEDKSCLLHFSRSNGYDDWHAMPFSHLQRSLHGER